MAKRQRAASSSSSSASSSSWHPVYIEYASSLEPEELADAVFNSPNFQLHNDDTSRGLLWLTEPAFPSKATNEHWNMLLPHLCPSLLKSTNDIRVRMAPTFEFKHFAVLRQVCKIWREFFTLQAPTLNNAINQEMFFGRHFWEFNIAQVFWACNRSLVKEFHLSRTHNLQGMRPYLCENLEHVKLHMRDLYYVDDAKTCWVPFFAKTTPRFTVVLENCSRHYYDYYHPYDLESFHEHVTDAQLTQSGAALPVLRYSNTLVSFPRLQDLTLRGLTILNLGMLVQSMPVLTRLSLINTFIRKGIAEGLQLLAAREGCVFRVLYDKSQGSSQNKCTQLNSPDVLSRCFSALEHEVAEIAKTKNPIGEFVFDGKDFDPFYYAPKRA